METICTRLTVWMCVCAKNIAIIKPYSHQEDVVVCCRSSSTVWEITARLSTVSWVAEAGKAHSFPSVWRTAIRSVSTGHTKKLRNDSCVVEWGFRWWMGHLFRTVEQSKWLTINFIRRYDCFIMYHLSAHSVMTQDGESLSPWVLTISISFTYDCQTDQEESL